MLQIHCMIVLSVFKSLKSCEQCVGRAMINKLSESWKGLSKTGVSDHNSVKEMVCCTAWLNKSKDSS